MTESDIQAIWDANDATIDDEMNILPILAEKLSRVNPGDMINIKLNVLETMVDYVVSTNSYTIK